MNDALLRPAIVMLHSAHDFDETDLGRCMVALEHPDTEAWSYGGLIWRSESAALPPTKILELANMLLQKPKGDDVVLDALGMKLHDTDKSVDTLGPELRRIGLIAAINRLSRDKDGNNDSVDYHMAAVLAPCLTLEGNDDEKSAWLNAIFISVDNHYGFAPGYNQAIQMTAASMPEAFLDRVFSGDERQLELRLHFLEHSGYRRSLLATDVERIVEWCRVKADQIIWTGVATAMDVFTTSGDEKSISVSDRCIQFLEASPYPEQVLSSFAGRITPNGWSGSRAEIMQRNTNALAVFALHQNPAVASSAKRIIAEAATWIAKERQRERREDEASEQRFE